MLILEALSQITLFCPFLYIWVAIFNCTIFPPFQRALLHRKTYHDHTMLIKTTHELSCVCVINIVNPKNNSAAMQYAIQSCPYMDGWSTGWLADRLRVHNAEIDVIIFASLLSLAGLQWCACFFMTQKMSGFSTGKNIKFIAQKT